MESLQEQNRQDTQPHRQEYLCQVLDHYRRTPGTSGCIRRADRILAAELYQRGIPLPVVQSAFVLAAARRELRGPDARPLATIRSLHYFLPVIEEIMENPPDPDYVWYLRKKLERYKLLKPD